MAVGMLRAVDKTKRCPVAELYIACEDMDFSWYQWEIDTVIEKWTNNHCITEIADALDRDCDEVAILLIDLARKEKIQPREGGIWGCRRSTNARGVLPGWNGSGGPGSGSTGREWWSCFREAGDSGMVSQEELWR